MELRGKFKVLSVIKKSSAVFFKDLKVGDEFELVYGLSGSYGNAPWIAIEQDGKAVHGNNALQLSNNLSRFILEMVK